MFVSQVIMRALRMVLPRSIAHERSFCLSGFRCCSGRLPQFFIFCCSAAGVDFHHACSRCSFRRVPASVRLLLLLRLPFARLCLGRWDFLGILAAIASHGGLTCSFCWLSYVVLRRRLPLGCGGSLRFTLTSIPVFSCCSPSLFAYLAIFPQFALSAPATCSFDRLLRVLPLLIPQRWWHVLLRPFAAMVGFVTCWC